MDEQQRRIERALNLLAEQYPDPKVSSNKSVGGSVERPEVIHGISYIRTGMKNSVFQHLIYDACTFENAALTGSQFRSAAFSKTRLNGNSFACCDFYDVEIDGDDCGAFEANNFSLSSFERCRFSELQLVSSGMLGSVFHNCDFRKTAFRSSTLEGTSFTNCHMENCDFGTVNVEFTHFARTVLDGVRFPFYQFPYVIGAADYISNAQSTVTLRVGEKTLPMPEYRHQLDNLILYFWDKREYFPMCNLYIATDAIQEARRSLLDGISAALVCHNFRMIRYFCQLALHHDILDEVTRHRVVQDVDNFLQAKDIPETRLNDYMAHVGSIRALLRNGSSSSVSLQFSIKTHVHRDDPEGIQYVSTLMNDLNQTLAQADGQDGFQITVANYSPYEIVINVLSAVGSAASIASLVWMAIDAVKKQAPKNRVEVDVETYRNYVDAKIDCLRADLLRLQSHYSQRRFSKYIDEVTQQLKTDLDELYSKDIMIFKVKNDSSPEEP